MKIITLMFTLLFSIHSHADWPSFFDRFRSDPPTIKIRRAFDESGVRLAKPIEIEFKLGDRVRFKVFEGEAWELIRSANLHARRAQTIRDIAYYDERGTDVVWDQRADQARLEALQKAKPFDVVAGKDMKLIAIKRLLEREKVFTTPNDGVAAMRDYHVPKAVLEDPVDPKFTRKTDCDIVFESGQMLEQERAFIRGR